MNKVEIHKKTFPKLNLAIGIIWFLSGFSSLLDEDKSMSFFNGLSLVLGILYIFLSFYERKPFYIIENKKIKKNHFPLKEFDLSSLSKIIRFASSYELVSEHQKSFKINTEIFDKASLQKLTSILEEYESKINKQWIHFLVNF